MKFFLSIFLIIFVSACSPSAVSVSDPYLRFAGGNSGGSGGNTLPQNIGGSGGGGFAANTGGSGGNVIDGAGGQGGEGNLQEIGGFGGGGFAANTGGAGGNVVVGGTGGQGGGEEPLDPVEVQRCKDVYCSEFERCIGEEEYCSQGQGGAGGGFLGVEELSTECARLCDMGPGFISALNEPLQCEDVVRLVSSQSIEVTSACFSDEEVCETLAEESYRCATSVCPNYRVLKVPMKTFTINHCVVQISRQAEDLGFLGTDRWKKNQLLEMGEGICDLSDPDNSVEARAAGGVSNFFLDFQNSRELCELENIDFFDLDCVPACERTVACSDDVVLDDVLESLPSCHERCVLEFLQEEQIEMWECFSQVEMMEGFCVDVGNCAGS